MFENLRQDTRRLREIKTKGFPWYVLESLLFENGYQAVVLYRIAHAFKRRRIPFLGPFFHRLSILLCGVDIAPGAVIGPGFRISHGVGIVIGNGATVGERCLMMQNVTLGAPNQSRIGDMPTVGNDVVLGAGACLIGKIEVGDHVLVGVNCVVTGDVAEHCKVLPPTEMRIVPRKPVKEERPTAGQ